VDEAVTKNGYCIPSAWVVRGLARGGSVHACKSCGARMFVRSASGLCPLCWNGRGPAIPTLPEVVVHVPAERALAGVLDDPMLEPDPVSHARRRPAAHL